MARRGCWCLVCCQEQQQDVLAVCSPVHPWPWPLPQGVCHRDLKLENTLLDGRPAPRLKICDFGELRLAAGSPMELDMLPCRPVLMPSPCGRQCCRLAVRTVAPLCS